LDFIEFIYFTAFTQIIEVVVVAAERCLGVRDLTSEELQGVLSGGVPSFQAVGLK
jgi:hypothetical protein